MKNACKNIDAFITAGGKSSRIGIDKGLIELSGKPMIGHILDTLSAFEMQITIIANSNAYNYLGRSVVSDIIPGKGPLGALLTALYYTNKKSILLLGCDVPFFPAEGIMRLIKNIKENSVTVTEDCGGLDPLHAIYPKSLQNNIEQRLAENKLRMTDFIFSFNYIPINMCDLEKENPLKFINFNTPEDIAQWKMNN